MNKKEKPTAKDHTLQIEDAWIHDTPHLIQSRKNNKNHKVNKFQPARSLEYIEILRFLACFAVILLHYSGSYTYRFGLPTFDLGILYFSLSRWCVPIFLMITGALLLNKNISILLFYKKRFLRILPPFIFWSSIYIGLKLFNDKIQNGDVINLIVIKGAEFHFWYIYLILGLLLLLPLFTFLIEKKEKISLIIFLILWIPWIIFQKQLKEISIGIDLLGFIRYFGYLGYLILGYYLHILIYKKHYWYIGIILFLIGFLYSFYWTIQISYEFQSKNELFQPYLSWNVLFMAVGVFLVVKQLRLPQYIYNIIQEISKYSFGIYLAHILIRDVFVGNYFNFLNFDKYSFLIIKSILVLFLSYVSVKYLNKIPIIGKYISG